MNKTKKLFVLAVFLILAPVIALAGGGNNDQVVAEIDVEVGESFYALPSSVVMSFWSDMTCTILQGAQHVENISPSCHFIARSSGVVIINYDYLGGNPQGQVRINIHGAAIQPDAPGLPLREEMGVTAGEAFFALPSASRSLEHLPFFNCSIITGQDELQQVNTMDSCFLNLSANSTRQTAVIMVQDTRTEARTEITVNFRQPMAPIPVPTPPVPEPDFGGMIDCSSIFRDASGNLNAFGIIMVETLRFLQYLAPILVIIFAIIDYVKAMVSQEKEEISKATIRGVKRLIIAIIVFFVPIIIIYAIGLSNIVADPLCRLVE